MNQRSLTVLFVSALLFIWIGFANYGRVVYHLFGEPPPATWNGDLLKLKHGELAQQYGNPTGMPVKGFQYWEKHYWWGRHLLQIGYLECCDSASVPNSVYVMTYVKGKYDAVAVKRYSREK